MGGGTYDDDKYISAAKSRAVKGIPDFSHSVDVLAGRAKGIHPDLDPLSVAGINSPYAGRNIRESRDSTEHPNSLPIIIIFDVTGSMGNIPKVVQKKLCGLMDTIIKKANVPDPQILVGAVGDTFSDQYPIQVGQFESDNRIDDQLREIILEGGGGGTKEESYALAYYFAANHTATDAYEKRKHKGYIFTMGDEAPYRTVTKRHAEKYFNDIAVLEDESIESLLKCIKEKWNVYHLFSMDGSYPKDRHILDAWKDILADHLIMVKDSSTICETIANIIYHKEHP